MGFEQYFTGAATPKLRNAKNTNICLFYYTKTDYLLKLALQQFKLAFVVYTLLF